MKKLFGKTLVILLALLFTLQIVPMTAYADGNMAQSVPDAEEVIAQMADEASDDAEIAAIVCEDVSARTANEKQYLLEDGSYLLTQYDVPVHYENENGELVDIDNTLTYNAAENAEDFDGYVNGANTFSVKFADNTDERIFNFNEDGYTIDMGLADNAANSSEITVDEDEPVQQLSALTTEELNEQVTELDTLTSKVLYNGALAGADLEYTVLPNGIKEDIVINTRQGEYAYSFVLNTDNLSLIQNDDGSISLMADDAGTPEEKYHIPAPYMIDANNKISYDVSYNAATDGNGRYILTVTADEEWINDSDTVLPVRIDPSIIKSYSFAYFDDAYVMSGANYINGNYSTSPLLLLGRHAGMGYGRAYYKVDLASMPEGTEMIRSAKLHLMMNLSQSSRNAVSIVCKRPLTAWNTNTITWSNQPELDSNIMDYEVFAADASSLDIDITKAFASDYYNGTELGFAIVCENESESLPALAIGSSRHTHSEYLPTVEVVFNKQKGLDSTQTYLPIDCGQYGKAYINTYNGDLTYIHKVFESDDGKINLSSIYNQYMANTDFAYESVSHDPEDIILGKHWKLSAYETVISISENEFNSQMLLEPSDDESATYGYAYLYNDMYGTNIYLIASGNDGLEYTFKDQYGRDYTLTVTRESVSGELVDAEYELTTPDGAVKTFDLVDVGARKKGYMTSSVKDGVTTTCTYDSEYVDQLNTVKASGSRKYASLSYDGNDDTGYVTSIEYSGTTKAAFTYEAINSGNSNISAIQNVGVGTAMFGYNGNGKLTNINEADGGRLSFEYNSYGRLIAVTCKKSSSAALVRTEISYDLGTTTVHYFGEDAAEATDDDIIIRYVFDASGKNIGAFPMTADGRIHERIIDTSYESFDDIAAINGDNAYANYMEKDVSAAAVSNTSSRLITVALSTDEHYLGNYSYKVSSTRNNTYLHRYMSLESGQHTFSAYVKCTDGMTKTVDDETVYVPITISVDDTNDCLTSGSFADVTVTDANISEHMTPETASSNKIIPQRIYKTDAAVNNGWQKITCSFNIEYDENNEDGYATDAPAEMSLNIGAGCAGAFYVDEISIDGQLLSWYSGSNVVISSGFESPDIYWETGNCPYTRVTRDANKIINPAYSESNAEYSPENVLFGEYSFKVEGDLNDDDKALYHTEYLNTTDISKYALKLSGWGKANSLPISGPDAPQGFELFAYYVYYVTTADGTSEMRTASTAVPFNWQIDDWQYVSKELNLPTAGEGETISKVYSVTFGVLYKGNMNTAYFDNVELARVAG